MCGRYFLAIEDYEVKKIIAEINEILAVGEIFPTNQVPLINQEGVLTSAKWGLENTASKKPIINARSETAHEKYFFKNSLKHHRCLLPASAYYEWNTDKEKFQFTLSDTKLMFMAGLLKENSQGEQECVILTREASEAVGKIHHRMPVILSPMLQINWLQGKNPQDIFENCIKEDALSFHKVN